MRKVSDDVRVCMRMREMLESAWAWREVRSMREVKEGVKM